MTMTMSRNGTKAENPALPGSRAAWLALGLAILAWLAFPSAGLLVKQGVVGPLTGLSAALGGILLLGGAGLLVALFGLWRARGRGPAAAVFYRAGAGGIVALGALGLVLFWMLAARQVPPIHDISTDTADPPAFAAVLAERQAEGANSTDLSAAVAAQQKAAYPDLRTLSLKQPAAEVFPKALDAAKAMGWRIDAADPAAGRIEATASTFWMGFKDDIVVRVAAAPDGTTKLDVRSESRVGRSDLGVNAKRIRGYLQRLGAG